MRLLFVVLLAWAQVAQAQGNQPGYDADTVSALADQFDTDLASAVVLLDRSGEAKRLARNQRTGSPARMVHVLYQHAMFAALTAQSHQALLDNSVWITNPTRRKQITYQANDLWQQITQRVNYFKLWHDSVLQMENCEPYRCEELLSGLGSIREQLESILTHNRALRHQWMANEI